ncbi:MBL fold metallo-hydrolase [bacterium]|nr:MBL fold metallo-hydrolase [candidate division CSSED10-310 bacterium]
MKITIVFDNTSRRDDLREGWGFACIVDAEGHRILFDTGADGSILLNNMRTLDLDPASVETVFISHDHWDHTGGLPDLLEASGRHISIYIPASCKGIAGDGVIRVDSPLEIFHNIHSTGELEHIEQSMIIKLPDKVVVIAGCSHPGVNRILQMANRYGTVRALIGGLHGFSEFELLRDMDLVCATHCTQHIPEIEALYPGKAVPGGAGTVIEL